MEEERHHAQEENVKMKAPNGVQEGRLGGRRVGLQGTQKAPEGYKKIDCRGEGQCRIVRRQ